MSPMSALGFVFFSPTYWIHNFSSAQVDCQRNTNISEGQCMMKEKLTASEWSTLVIQHGGLSERDFLLVQLYEEWPSVLNPGTVQCYTEQSEESTLSRGSANFPVSLWWAILFFLYCCGSWEQHTSGIALDYLLGLCITDTKVASCPTPSVENFSLFNLATVDCK